MRCRVQAATAATAGKSTEQVRVAVLGASGYTGEEVVRLLSLHPTFKVTALTGDRQAGKVGCWLGGAFTGAGRGWVIPGQYSMLPGRLR